MQVTALPSIYKKLLGTAALVVAILASVLTVSGQASAFFSFMDGDLNFSATVSQVYDSSIQVDKGGIYPFAVVVNGDTDFNDGYSSLDSVAVGDRVRINAREDQGILVVEDIEPILNDGYGYGTACEAFEASDVYLSSIEDGALYLSRAGITFYVSYDNNTSVIPGEQSISDLQIGEYITIRGQDCGEQRIVGDTVVRAADSNPGQLSCQNLSGYGLLNQQYLLSHDAGGAFTDMRDIAVPAGTYNVYGVSYDDHSNHAWDTLANEAWYIEAYNAGSPVFTSSATDDLPDGVDRNTTMIGSNVAISGIDQLRFVHNAYVDASYQSILPECVIFVPASAVTDTVVSEDR